MTTSTESAGSGICSITPLRKCAFVTPASRGVPPREREHLVGHVEPVGDARSGRRASPRGSRRSRRRSRGRAPSRPRAARRPRSGCRSRATRAPRPRGARRAARRRRAPRRTSLASLGVGAARAARRSTRSSPSSVDRRARPRRSARRTSSRSSSAASSSSHTSFRSTTPASFAAASALIEKYAHLPRCSRSSRPASRQLLQVMADGRLREPERGSNSQAQTGSPRVGEQVDDPHARRIAERLEQRRRGLRLRRRQGRRGQRPAAGDEGELGSHRIDGRQYIDIRRSVSSATS